MARTVFITGGTGSVGRALVESFCLSGYRVFFQYNTNRTAAEELANAHGGTALSLDFSKTTSLDVEATDILINNAAVNISRVNTIDVTLEDWEKNILINLSWPFVLIKRFLPYMMHNRWGRIVNISSIYGLRACEGNLPYNVSKHGLSALTKTVAKEYGQYGITTNEICPGPIESDLLDRIAQYHTDKEGISKSDYFASIVEDIPAGRLATPADIAKAALFLASEQAGYINGVSIPVDGGLIA